MGLTAGLDDCADGLLDGLGEADRERPELVPCLLVGPERRRGAALPMEDAPESLAIPEELRPEVLWGHVLDRLVVGWDEGFREEPVGAGPEVDGERVQFSDEAET